MSEHGWDSSCPMCASVRRGIEQASRGEHVERDDLMTDEDMCPNCVTPWKCNGPHVVVHEATVEESAEIASRDLKRALRELDGMPASHDADHVRMYIRSALIWLGHGDE